MQAEGVSYVVTIYNKARYLEGVIAALRNQQGQFERQYILVDDGSSDGSGELARRLVAGLPGAELISQQNSGPSVAVNRGIAHARLSFTQIVDGDDILAPYASRLLLRAAAESGCGAIYGHNGYYSADAAPAFPPEPAQVPVRVLDDALYTVIRIGHAGGSTHLLDTAALKRAGGADERVFIQDQSLAQRMALVTRVGFIDPVVAMGPRDEPGRIMKFPAQLQHDQSLSALLTLKDHSELPARFRRLVQKQVTGRAWKYAARHGGASYLSRYFRLFLAARVPGVRLDEATLFSTLDAFRRSSGVRLMPSIAAGNAARATSGAAPARQSAARSDP
ncbi:MAG TPA: glycosyltransferase family 2 protein [Stellaceae bacterium]|nr:glycosyltransferase family 2 protein [Stellaceae bacterium]